MEAVDVPAAVVVGLELANAIVNVDLTEVWSQTCR